MVVPYTEGFIAYWTDNWAISGQDMLKLENLTGAEHCS